MASPAAVITSPVPHQLGEFPCLHSPLEGAIAFGGLIRQRKPGSDQERVCAVHTVPVNAAERIEQFLADHPHGDLWIAVGYVTPAGIGWLNDRTQGRRVHLLIGNTQSAYWENVAAGDNRSAAGFLKRQDTAVKNWYRTAKSKQGASDAHLKAWLVADRGVPVAALVGSANLTRKGLEENAEMMVEATGDDLARCCAQMGELHAKGWDCAERLLDYLGTGGTAKKRTTKARKRHSAKRKPPPPPPPRSRALATRSSASTAAWPSQSALPTGTATTFPTRAASTLRSKPSNRHGRAATTAPASGGNGRGASKRCTGSGPTPASTAPARSPRR